jgi:tRNA nucleotidyltransferase/poly(A) polymerase
MTTPGLPPTVMDLLPALGPEPVWLVGGAVRDLLLGASSEDFDFAVQGDGVALGRRLANTLGADYYDLDPTRRTGRLLLTVGDGRRVTLDFAALRGRHLHEDLERRDFTVNAMALALTSAAQRASHPEEEPGEGRAAHPGEGRAAHPGEGTPQGGSAHPADTFGPLIDPLGGAGDLRKKLLRACAPDSIASDPVRSVRALRFAIELGLHLDGATTVQVRAAAGRLGEVSPERLRDEFFRLLAGPDPGAGLRTMDRLGLLTDVLPELEPLRGLEQPPPHAFDALEHTLATADRLARLAALLAGRSGKAEASDLAEASALARLGTYQQGLRSYLDFAPSYGRSRASLMLWTALLHDTGKARSRAIDDTGRIRFFGHETIGSRIAVEASRRIRLSVVEQAEVEMTVLHHMRPEWLEADGEPTRRAVYRFFRAAEATGPSVVLLSLADLLARDVPPVAAAAWHRRLDLAGRLLQGWFERRMDVVHPALLLSGEEIMALRGLSPGPDVGRVVEALREAQAAGEVMTKEEAEIYVRDLKNP